MVGRICENRRFHHEWMNEWMMQVKIQQDDRNRKAEKSAQGRDVCPYNCPTDQKQIISLMKNVKYHKRWTHYDTKTYQKLQCGPMPNVMAAQSNIGGAVRENSVIPFLVPRCKVWLTPAARVPCSKLTLPIYTVNHKNVTFYFWRNSTRDCSKNLPHHLKCVRTLLRKFK